MPEDSALLIIDYDTVDGEGVLDLVDNALDVPMVTFHHGGGNTPLDHLGQRSEVLLRRPDGLGPHVANVEEGVRPDDGPENEDEGNGDLQLEPFFNKGKHRWPCSSNSFER